MVVNSLSTHPCFRTLDPEACRVLDRHCIWLKTAAGQWLIGQTANDRDVFFVVSGRLRAVLHGVRQDLIFSDMEAGSFFGELAALDGAPRSLSVFAVNDSLVAKMPSAIFVETMYTHRPLGEAVVATLVARNRAMTRRVGELGALDVRSRVHAELLRLAHPDRDDPKRAIILAPPNQSELASRINTRRETVSREINAMEREGLIERRRGAIVIKDALRLSARTRGDSRRRVGRLWRRELRRDRGWPNLRPAGNLGDNLRTLRSLRALAVLWRRISLERIEDLKHAVCGAGLKATRISRGRGTGGLSETAKQGRSR